MLNLKHSQLQRYSVAVLAVVVALLFTQLLRPLLKPTLYPLFLGAVMVGSWYGGIGPGLLTTALATLACAYFFIPPLYLLAIDGDGIIGLIQFVLIALLIILLNAVLRSTQQRAEKNALAAQSNYNRLRQTQEILRQSEERYRLLVERATDYAIFMLDSNGNIISWNIGAERILGYPEAEIINQPFSLIFTPEAIESGKPEQELRKAVANGFAKENRWHVRKDGTCFWSYCYIAPLQDKYGNLRGFSKIMQDTTERKQAEEERQQLLIREQTARAVAEAANRSKDEFLALLSHELRTPLTAILGWAGILHAGKLDEAGAALAVETIERNANLQMQLIEDLLDVSQIIRGELSLNCRFIDLLEVIEMAIKVVQPVADAKKVKIESVLDSSAGTIWGDSERLQQVVWNLLSNAIKFSPNGGHVEVQLLVVSDSTEAKDKYTQIQVSDTGKGISADFLPYIFERFRQADKKSTRAYKGLGLGLPIARHLVELHGGTIEAESPGDGQGATFTVKLPQKADFLQAGLTDKPDQEQPSRNGRNVVPLDIPLRLDGLRVLIVDDEADTREWVSVVLQECGAQVTSAGSVDEGIEVLEQLKPDVLVSDIGMPGQDGYALIGKVRELELDTGGRIPAVALTAYASVEDYKEALSAGFQLHVAKPVRAAELVAVVASLGHLSEKL